MAEGGNNSASCPVCFEEYSDSGDHVPRLMPCSHTLYQKCIKALLEGGLQIECTECRKKHQAPQAERSFPQNKYILENMALKARIAKLDQADRKEETCDLCPDHQEKLILFCKNTTCRKLICRTCLTKSHKHHDFVDMSEGQQIIRAKNLKMKEALLGEIDRELGVQEKVRSNFLKAQQEVSQKLATTLEKLRREKQTVMERFEERIEKEQEDTNTQAKRLIADLDSKTDLLRSIREAAQRGFRNIPGNQHADKGRYRRCCPSQIHWEQWGKFDKNCWQGSGRCLVTENRKSSAWPKKTVWNIGQASG